MLRDAPAPDHGGDGADRERASAAPRAAAKQHEYGEAAEEREDHERQPVAGEAVEEVPRVAVQQHEAGGRERPGDDRGDHRAGAEVALEGRAGAPGVADEEDRGDVRARGDEQGPDQQRQRVEPAVTASPAAFPTGTRPPAIAPTTVPMKKGVSSDAAPKSSSDTTRPRTRRAVLWNAKPTRAGRCRARPG